MNPEHLINLAFLHLADDVKKAMSNVRFFYFLKFYVRNDSQTSFSNRFRIQNVRIRDFG